MVADQPNDVKAETAGHDARKMAAEAMLEADEKAAEQEKKSELVDLQHFLY